MYTEIRLLIILHLIISSFFSLSNFQFILIYLFSSDSAIIAGYSQIIWQL